MIKAGHHYWIRMKGAKVRVRVIRVIGQYAEIQHPKEPKPYLCSTEQLFTETK